MAEEGERLQKVLASHGIASRRGAEDIISEGRVTVNGVIATLGQRVTLGPDRIVVDGREIVAREEIRYVALNKPVGIVSSLRSTHGERTVTELVALDERIFPVGRLDKETSGLLLLTNDGEWANLVTHPRYQVEKEYVLVVRGRPSTAALTAMRTGVTLPDGSITAPAQVDLNQSREDKSYLSVTVIEGKKRQLRLMAAAIGHSVVSLRRVRVGSIRLAGLPEGRWRPLSTEEVESIRAHSIDRVRTAGSSTQASHRDRRPSGRG